MTFVAEGQPLVAADAADPRQWGLHRPPSLTSWSLSSSAGQLYTVSQDGTLCVWESDTQLDGLILAKSQDKDRGGEGQEDGEAEVIRGQPEVPKEQKKKSVRYKQISKYGASAASANTSLM